MAMRLIRREQWQTQNWKNGGGITHQLWRQEDEHGLLWRLSVAEVKTDGPFSRFDGIDRVLMVLQGEGLVLQQTGCSDIRLTPQTEPYCFDGEAAIYARLIGAEVQDFNLMTRRGALKPKLQALELAAGERLSLAANTEQLLFIQQGELLAACDSLELQTTDLLWLQTEAAMVLQAKLAVRLIYIELATIA